MKYTTLGPLSYATFTVNFVNDKSKFSRSNIVNWSETNEVINKLAAQTVSGGGVIKSTNTVSYTTGFNIRGMGILVVGYHSPHDHDADKVKNGTSVTNSQLAVVRANSVRSRLNQVILNSINVDTFSGGEKTRSATIIIGMSGNIMDLKNSIITVPPSIGQ